MNVIKISNQGSVIDNHLMINLSSMFDIDKSRDINNFINKTTIKSINPVVDVEKTVFRSNTNLSIIPNIIYTTTSNGVTTSVYSNTFLNTLFTVEDISNYSEGFIKSFYLLEFYDSDDVANQSLVFDKRLYLRPVMTKSDTTGYNTIESADTDISFINFNILVPNNLLLNINSLYLKVRFYSAKTGLLYLFKNNNNDIFNNESLFSKIELDKVNNYWGFNIISNILYQYNNEFVQATVDNESINKQKTNSNSDKGDFINKSGNYQVII
jgi:hypothetical protein